MQCVLKAGITDNLSGISQVCGDNVHLFPDDFPARIQLHRARNGIRQTRKDRAGVAVDGTRSKHHVPVVERLML